MGPNPLSCLEEMKPALRITLVPFSTVIFFICEPLQKLLLRQPWCYISRNANRLKYNFAPLPNHAPGGICGLGGGLAAVARGNSLTESNGRAIALPFSKDAFWPSDGTAANPNWLWERALRHSVIDR
jgi:hypothetical protein